MSGRLVIGINLCLVAFMCANASFVEVLLGDESSGGSSLSGAASFIQTRAPRPLTDASALPREAQGIIEAIISMLSEVRALPRDESSDLDFTQRQMDATYLPSVISAYLIIPESHRDKHASALIQQLETLRGETASILDRVADESAADLEVNGIFLQEKFGRPVDALRSLRDGSASTPPSPALEATT